MGQLDSAFGSGDAIFALATAPGRSAVAIFRCSGAKVWQHFAGCFSRYAALQRAEGHSAVYGLLHWPERVPAKLARLPDHELIDEVLLLKFCAPKSFTGEDMLEVHCHGGQAVLSAVRQLLLALGLRQAQRGEFSYRSVRCGKRSLHQAEALALLTRSHSQNQRRLAMEQLHSPLQQKLQHLRQQLLQVLARTELQLDYDETELEFTYPLPDSLPLARSCRQFLADSLAAFQLQQRCWQESQVVLVGASNSGKSSLFNCLLASERAIVSPQAGTTRDYLSAQLELDGQAVQLFDTAGLRLRSPAGASDEMEQEGIRRSWQLLEQADCLLLVCDVRVAAAAFLASAAQQREQSAAGRENRLKNNLEHSLEDWLRQWPPQAQWHQQRQQITELAAAQQIPLLEVCNKVDLLPPELLCAVERLGAAFFAGGQHGLFSSAKSGFGLPQLVAQLEAILGDPAQSAGARWAPPNERQATLLRQACGLLEEYCCGLEGRESELFDLDWAAELLRQICARLGEVTGQAANAQMLREIFQQFCLGK